jgi:outer membrane protein
MNRVLWRARRAGAVVLTVLAGAGVARAETLGEAIALAYASNPTLQGQRASLRALDESVVQAEAGYHPTATLQGTITTDTNNATNPLTRPLPGVSNNVIDGQSQTTGLAIGLTQPLYTGGRVANQVSAAEAGVLAGRETLRGTEETLIRDVITVYADVRRDQRIVAILEDDVKLLLSQLTEARARFAVGEITRTDVAETEARVSAAQAELDAARVQVANSCAQYAAIVGRNPAHLEPEPPIARLLPANLDMAFEWAERNSPQIRQAAFTERDSAAKLAGAKALTRPTVALQATAGFSGGTYQSLATPFAGYSRDVTATVVANIPIFTGGSTSSQIRQAAETNNADRIGIETARRQVLLTLSQAWNGLIGARAGLAAHEAQVKSANIAYEGARQEARVGLRSTLDVLIQEENLASAQVALIGAKHDEYVAAAAVLGAVGVLYANDFDAGTVTYDPKANLAQVRRSWPFAPWTPAIAAIDRTGAPGAPPVPETTPPPPQNVVEP